MDEYVYSYLCPTAIQTVLEDEESFPPLNKKVQPGETLHCASVRVSLA
jgi:hypothetical protein